jgi:Domain of unknown function (DUF4760)
MSLQLANTLATFGTFVVIAATAIAALVQLRHARSSNQIEALAELREGTENPEMRSAERIVRHDLVQMMKDPAFRYELANQEAMTAQTQSSWSDIRRVANFFENMGALVKNGLADERLVLDIFSDRVSFNWEVLSPVVVIVRESTTNEAIWENFEYLAVLAEDWMAAHPKGNYPAGVRRKKLKYAWREADEQYAATVSP